jgi:glyoxylase-like metal-dependent hydrolase (beta-lactamase superfamily II)
VIRVRCLRTGVVREKRGERGLRRYLLDSWRAEALPVNAFLVEHPDGLCLFDTGQTARAASPDYFPRWQPFFRLARFELEPEDEASAQLARIGASPADVRWVVLSHLHTDHAGGIAPFTSAEVIVSRLEWESAQGLRGRIRGYLPQEWPERLAPRLVDFDGIAFGPFSASYDVAGDGHLLLVPLPGHTRGHAALLVQAGTRKWLLGGDAAHSADELPAKAPATADFCARHGVVFLAAHDPRAESLVAGD